MTVNITILAENTVASGTKLIGEHGLSFLIEDGRHRILFDTGQGRVLPVNTADLGIDLASLDGVVLSHGHYDHTGGLDYLLKSGALKTVWAHPDVFDEKLKSAGSDQYTNIGMPLEKDVLTHHGVNLKLSKSATEILPGMITTGEIPMVSEFESIEPIFFIRRKAVVMPDPMTDDQAMVMDTSKGIVVILGCTHRGLINTLRHVSELTGKKKIHAIIGGLHLGSASDGKIRQIINLLGEFDLDIMHVGHCTGFRAAAALLRAFPGRVALNTVGRKIVF